MILRLLLDLLFHVSDQQRVREAIGGDDKTPVRLGIAVGHKASAKGAKSPWLGYEWDFNSTQAQRIKEAARGTAVDVIVKYFDPALTYTDGLKKVYAEFDALDVDCVVELHFNSFPTATANGTEVLRSSSAGSKLLAEMLQKSMLDNFGLKHRSILLRRRHGKRGWYSLYAGRAPAVLIEPGFGSNKKDSAAIKKNWPAFAEDIIGVVQEWKKLR